MIGSMSATSFPPLRSLDDIEEIERMPHERLVPCQDANVWIREGHDRAPHRIAIRDMHDGNPGSEPVCVTYGALKRQSLQAANLLHARGVRPGDAVLFL